MDLPPCFMVRSAAESQAAGKSMISEITTWPAAALLLIEVDGHPAVVAEETEKVEAIWRRHGATEVPAAKDESE